jgi:outer membrane protein assembly factor BamB
MRLLSLFFVAIAIHAITLPASADEPVKKLIADDWRRDNAKAARKTWPSFRGIAARGIAVGQHLPEQWNVEKGEGVRWKTPIPGLGNSCPVVWNDKVFVTTAVSSAGIAKLKIGLYGAGDSANDKSKHSWRLYCLDHRTGRIVWQRVAHEGVPPVSRHTKSSQANSTPATDGKHVVALFNSGGLHCYNMDGKLLWKKDLGVLNSGAFDVADLQWGFGSSPIIYENMVIVQCDLQADSFLAAFEIDSGKQVWRVPRDELPSWGTPTVCETAGGPLLIVNATNFVRGYEARTGKLRWKLARNAFITVPTPIVGHDLIFVSSGYRPIQPIYAIKLNAVGDISLDEKQDSNKHIAWSKSRGGPYLPTPILYGNHLYTLGNDGIFTCYEAKTGTQIYRKRCGNGAAASFTASPVAADGKIYVTAESGVVIAIKAGPEFEILSRHPIGGYCLSTPAIAGGRLLLRTQSHVIAIGTTKNVAE